MSGARTGSLWVREGLELPGQELKLSFARSGGPGGQNVNKVETKVLLRFSIDGSRTLDEEQRQRLRLRLAGKLTAAGEVLVRADRYRDRPRNVEDARERLARLLAEALATPRRRKPSRPHRSAVERRLGQKHRHGELKRARRGRDE